MVAMGNSMFSKRQWSGVGKVKMIVIKRSKVEHAKVV